MFCFLNDDGDTNKNEYCIKPMNCPGHCLVFSHQSRSHNELPKRFADFGILHRNELSGALNGLTRVRKFCQDDAHIFCKPDQIDSEIKHCISLLDKIYKIFGFEYHVELSTRPDNFLGDIELWNRAEDILKNILVETYGDKFTINPGDGAFYGPKIDIHVKDNLNRTHQCGTIQLDFVMPSNFKLAYIDVDNSEKPPVMIHRAIYGSFERFLALLIEHYEGIYPFWLSPNQVMIIPVNNNDLDISAYVNIIQNELRKRHIYVNTDYSTNTLNKKILNASTIENKYNYILIIGKKEASQNTLAIRSNIGQESMSLTQFIAKIDNEMIKL